MVNSKDDTGAESEGYEKPTAKSTNTHKLKSIQVTLQQKQTPTSTNPHKQISIQVIPKTDNSKVTPPKEKPTAKSNQLPKHKRITKSPKEPHKSPTHK